MDVVTSAPALVAVGAVQEHPDNPNRGDVEAIGQSIDINGFYGSIIVQRATGFVIAGNHRLRAAIEAGATEVPVMYADVDDTEAKRIMLADNRFAQLSTTDAEALDDVMALIEAGRGSLLGTGIDEAERRTMEAAPSGRTASEALEVYETTTVRQIVAVYEPAVFATLSAKLAQLRQGIPAATNMEVLQWALNQWRLRRSNVAPST